MGTLWYFMLPWAILLLSVSPVVTIIKENNLCIWKQSGKVFLGNLILFFLSQGFVPTDGITVRKLILC